MILPLTLIKEALYSPAEHFIRLRGIEPLTCHRLIPNIERTYLAAESNVRWRGGLYKLYIPLSKESTKRLRQLQKGLEGVRTSRLSELLIFENDLNLIDTNSRHHYCDAVMQRVERLFTLEDALGVYPAYLLLRELAQLQKEMECIGFTHNNLKPSNILLREDGTMYLIRYWYAELGEGCRDDFVPLYNFVMRRGEKPAKRG